MSEVLRSAFRRALRRDNRRAAPRRGRLDRIDSFESAILGNSRKITVYLPPGYDDRDDRRYPVLYMQDGQNLFDPERAFIRGNHWRLGEAADDAIGERTASPMIIVGIDNAGIARVEEYTPTRDEKRNAGGRANDYGRMLIEELIPLIDRRYRTLPHETSIGGSSLGGLLSLFLVLRHPHLFRAGAVMSPSVWWDGRAILSEVDSSVQGERPRIWLDTGGKEGREALTDTRLLRERLMARGWNDETLRYVEDRRGDHSERAWAGRARPMLEFLFPPE
ncbi:MAG TPA: alpha/beta hydrolase-fold protein [Thermoanaerobaculia bacterium]|nr:alpha/beta hydrolase-fold protein [Thermoanaerobaculia bacterium]